jgi:hypothetical protein
VQLGRKPQTPNESDAIPGERPDLAFESAARETPSFWTGDERREADRRSQPTRPLKGLLTPLRRAAGRRQTDRASYVDRYTKQDVLLLLTIFILNMGDAFFTMMWLGRGGREANPVMDFFLDIGPWAFLAQKCIVVGLWLVILLVHKNFRFARIGLYSALVVYGALMIVHFGIIAFGVRPPKLATPRALPAPIVNELPGSRQLPKTRALAIEKPRIRNDVPALREPADRPTWE